MLSLPLLLVLALQGPADPIALVGARVVTGTGVVFDPGTVLCRNGLIEAVGPAGEIEIPWDAETIDLEGLVLHAAFIDGTRNALLELPEAEADQDIKPDASQGPLVSTRTANRKGVTPEVRAAHHVVTGEAGGEAHRKAGFGTLLAAPTAGTLSGQSALVALSGQPRRLSVMVADIAQHAALRTTGSGYPRTLMAILAHLRQTLMDAEQWLQWREAARDGGAPRPPIDPVFEALVPVLAGLQPVFFEAHSYRDIERALKLRDEFGLSMVLVGAEEAYEVLDRIRASGVPVLVGLDWGKEPEDPDKGDKEEGSDAEEEDEEEPDAQEEDDEPEEPGAHWKPDEEKPLRVRRQERADWIEKTGNAARLIEAGVTVGFTTLGVDSPGEFRKRLRRAIESGLPADDALATLNAGTAGVLEASDSLGTIEQGKAASLVALTGGIADKKTRTRLLVTDGWTFEFEADPDDPDGEDREPPADGVDLTGSWVTSDIEVPVTLVIEQEANGDLTGSAKTRMGSFSIEEGWVSGRRVEIRMHADFQGFEVSPKISGTVTDDGTRIEGTFVLMGTGEGQTFTATRAPDMDHLRSGAPVPGGHDDDGGGAFDDQPTELDEDRVPALSTGGNALIRGATVWPIVTDPFIGDVLVTQGRIAEVGTGLDAPEGHTVIDGTDRHVIPGMVDAHSHTAIERGINEGSLSITAECRIADEVDDGDLGIFRQAAGGLTTARLLHGSSNTIGGQDEVIKLKWGEKADGLRFPGRRQGIKFALGENVTRANGGGRRTRFPSTRMGVEAVLIRAFEAAEDYRARHATWSADPGAGIPPRRDLRLDALTGILDGDIDVHSHSYRADEILMLLRVAERFDFTVRTFQHVLEGYKVAPELAEHGAGASTFSDWWAYKLEAYDATPYNGALMHEAGVLTTFNSDSSEMARRMNLEAAKAVRFGRLSESDALAFVTLNAAKQLGIGDRVGSIEPGKDADLAIFDGPPLSVYSKCVLTLVDGEVVFTRRDAFGLDTTEGPAVKANEPGLDPVGLAATGTGPIHALTRVRIVPVSGPVTEDGTIVWQDGRILAVGSRARVTIPIGAHIRQLPGHTVWPGMVDAANWIGIAEINSIRGTQDHSDLARIQPDLLTTTAVNADSATIPVARVEGITSSIVVPSGGLVSGQSGLIAMAGWTREEMTRRAGLGLHIRFPRLDDDSWKDPSKDETIMELADLFEEARRYGDRRDHAEAEDLPFPMDTVLEALVPYARGEGPVVMRVDRPREIVAALEFAETHGLRLILHGVREGWKVADRIAEAGVPAIVGNVFSTPAKSWDPYDSGYANAALLHRAGVRIALTSGGGSDSSAMVRTLPFQAGVASAYGLPHDAAIEAVTLGPAVVWGVDDLVGSLEPGKRADLVVTKGDLLEITTEITGLWIDGDEIPLTSKHTELYERYRQRLTQGR